MRDRSQDQHRPLRPPSLLCVGLAATLAVGLAAFEASAGGARHADHKIEMVSESLDLSEDQQAEVREIFGSQSEQMSALREARRAGELDRDAYREARARLRDDTAAQIEAVLDDVQLEEFEELRAAHRGPPRGRHGRRHPGAEPLGPADDGA